ncbi:NAD(P)/FAD-dependent oxidoreductase, partial [Chromobacterium amazonense]
MSLVYIIDVDVANEDKLFARFKGDRRVAPTPDTNYYYVGQAPAELKQRPVVVGFGPCGIFAALILAQMGFKPIVLERGKEVRQRTKDTWGLWRKSQLNTESNVQYGEGGAGTFSDGKLYSQIKDPRHLGRKVLAEFVKAGAPEEILYLARPHIGTFRLVSMVE